MGEIEDVGFWVRVRVAGIVDGASESSRAHAITIAIAKSLGIHKEATG
jgi:hypothetical protein